VRDVYVVVPDGIDDPARPSGGNTYDRHLLRELGSHGWSAQERAVAGFWDRPGAASFAALEGTLRQIPDDAVVLLDGLIASTAPEVLVPQADRLRLIVLVHMPLGHRPPDDDTRRRERAVLTAATATVTTSAWSRHRLIELYDLPEHRVRVAEPGAPAAKPASGTEAGEALLCVGAVTIEKGHDVLLEALESIAALSWTCTCVGNLDRDPAFVEGLRGRVLDRGLGERVSFAGTRTEADLDRGYASADLLVHPSRAETYGLVVTEALAHGLPVIAADVGGLAEALGEGDAGTRPGLLVAPEDPAALAGALSAWLGDAELRARLRRAAGERRESLPRWSTTASDVARVLAEASP
jgi:glycosyltransferase involved in cell wall biosynthesis